MVPTLAICSALFLLGLVSDYFWGERAKAGSWWASILYAVTPNWQLFWLADALEGTQKIPLSYLAAGVWIRLRLYWSDPGAGAVAF